MNEHLLYLAIDAGVLFLPLLFSFHPRIRFDKHWGAFFRACSLVAIMFITWDIIFMHAGIWGFNERYLIGWTVIDLPLEECLFFICIPYACLFTYHCMTLLKWRLRIQPWLIAAGVVGIILVMVGVFNYQRAYTFASMGLCGAVLIWLAFVVKALWLPRIVITYLVIMPFFLISNGLLTGSWIPEEVVWYNDAENLGLRVGTIPVEDAVFGFSLILLNTLLFERFRKHSEQRPGFKGRVNPSGQVL